MAEKPQPDFNLADLESILRQMGEKEAGGVTTDEVIVATGLGSSTVRSRMRRLWKQGKLERCRRQIESMAGYMMWVSAYRLKPEKEGGEADGEVAAVVGG